MRWNKNPEIGKPLPTVQMEGGSIVPRTAGTPQLERRMGGLPPNGFWPGARHHKPRGLGVAIPGSAPGTGSAVVWLNLRLSDCRPWG